mgnify:CR=1 FL=1
MKKAKVTEASVSEFFQKVFLLTGLVFSVHLGLTLFSLIVEVGMLILPILFIPDLTVPELFSYIPVLFLFDLGLVSLVVYILTRLDFELELKWVEKMKRELKPPQIWVLLIMVTAGALFIFLRLRYGTIFVFIGVLNLESILILTMESLSWLSTIIIISLMVSIIVYFLRFYYNSEVIITFKKIIDVIILWFVIRYPYTINESIFQEYPALKNLLPLFKFLIMFITAVVVYEMIRSLINLVLEVENKI